MPAAVAVGGGAAAARAVEGPAAVQQGGIGRVVSGCSLWVAVLLNVCMIRRRQEVIPGTQQGRFKQAAAHNAAALNAAA